MDNNKLDRSTGKDKALYEQITERLRHQIDIGQIKPGQPLPTVSSLVKEWKVNYRTIYNALDKLRDDGLIQYETGRGKRPIVLRSSRKSHTIMYVRWGTDALSMGMTVGIKKFSEEQKLECIIVAPGNSREEFFATLKYASQHVGGMLMVPIYGIADALNETLNSGVNIVLLDRTIEGVDAASVSVDHVAGAYQVTTQLILRYGLPVFYIGYQSHISSTVDRYNGWATAMREAGFSTVDNYAEIIQFDELHDSQVLPNIVSEATRRLITKFRQKKYSIFTVNDYVAQGVYQAADEMHLNIGEDIYLVSFGNLPMCLHFPVPLASIDQKNEIVGHEAAKFLYLEMQGLWNKPVHRKVLGELVNRASSGF